MMEIKSEYKDVKVKIELLADGVALSKHFLDNYSECFLEKRRAYGNPDPSSFESVRIPQEIITSKKLVVAANINESSPFLLDFNDGVFFIQGPDSQRYKVTFPLRPKFYDRTLSSGEAVSQIMTLYGGCGLGIFVYGECNLIDMGNGCWFCSLGENKRVHNFSNFINILTVGQIEESLDYVIDDNSCSIDTILVNGGNFKDIDNGFKYYCDISKAVDFRLNHNKVGIATTLIAFPPNDLSLIDSLQHTKVNLVFNLEVFDSVLFRKYCPGKAMWGQKHIVDALKYAVNVLGKDRVHCVIVGGLEPLSSLKNGIDFLASNGITPMINILHRDPNTPIAAIDPILPSFIWDVGNYLQDIYREYAMAPVYSNCGRNSISGEAFKGLFV